ncbi:MAG TPA: hypothetical protein VII53_02360 [Solirubrobacteraceae bacterium]
MAIWTQRASIPWRQNIGFYERRYEILRDLEQKGLLRRFQDRPHQLAMRLQAAHQLVTFGADGLFFAALKPDSDLDVVRAAVEVVWEALAPEPQGLPLFNFQWLTPCGRPYDEARDVAAKAFVGSDHPARVTDFAVVLDGKFDEPFDDFHLAAGVVEAAETPGRLARGLSRGENERDVPPGIWSVEDLPAVAVFCQVEVDRISLEPGDIVEDAFSALESARDSADALRTSILTPLRDKKL